MPNSDLTQDVLDFHKKFGITSATDAPAFGDDLLMSYRIKFLEEELLETIKAYEENDLPSFLDGLVDLVYVAIGTAYMLKLPFDNAWKAVQIANMAKMRVENAADSKRKHPFDVVKPEGWTPPDIGKVIEDYKLMLAS